MYSNILVSNYPNFVTQPDPSQVYIHTERNVLIEVNPATRIPRTFDRFCGLMAQLLHKLSIHAEDGPKLLKVIKNPVSDYFPAGCRKYCMTYDAPRTVRAKELVSDEPVVMVIGKSLHPYTHIVMVIGESLYNI